MADQELVSCLCVTSHRTRLLARAVACFLRQTYQSRELIVVYGSADTETRDYLLALSEPSIRPVQVDDASEVPLGALRNRSIEASRGYYVATWDDDDWHAPGRLTAQINAIRESGKQGCLLSRILAYDGITDTAFVSNGRGWEGTLVAERAAMPSFPGIAKGEDTPVVKQMLAEGKLIPLDRPHLYVYTYHGANTWDRSNWERTLRPLYSPLAAEDQARVRALLDADCVAPSEGDRA